MNSSIGKSFCLEITAPGKIILFGEHSVVYGKKAVAATLGLYTKLHLVENESNSISLTFPSVGVDETFSLASLEEYFSHGNITEDDVTSLSKKFDIFYEKYGSKFLTHSQRLSLITFFSCLPSCVKNFRGFNLRVETDLPVGSGAGSSASFSITISAGLTLLELAKSTKLSDFLTRSEIGPPLLTEELKEIISKKAFLCECIFHGTPSGIDHSVILHGSILEFAKSDAGAKLSRIESGLIKVLLVDSKVSRSTKLQVEIFRRWKEKFPEIMQNILDAMGNVANDAIKILHCLTTELSELAKNESRLADLIDLNHGLLRLVGVSHASLEEICSIAKKYELSAKLTGAGGGGFGFVYLPKNISTTVVHDLKEELEAAGFDSKEITLGGPGLTITSLRF